MNSVWPTGWDVVLSSIRWCAGLTAGTVLGLLIAAADGYVSGRVRHGPALGGRAVELVLDFLRALPIIALVPVVQMLGVAEPWKIGLIAWAVMFPVWLAVRQARARELTDTETVMSACRLSNRQTLRSYQFPKALGGLLRGVEISIGVAWLSVVAAEWVGTYSTGFWAGGIGYRVVKAHEAGNWGGVLACLALFGLLGTTTAALWRSAFGEGRALGTGFNPMAGDARR